MVVPYMVGQAGQSGEVGFADGTNERPLKSVLSQMLPQRSLSKALRADRTGVLLYHFFCVSGFLNFGEWRVVQYFVEETFGLRISGEQALAAFPRAF